MNHQKYYEETNILYAQLTEDVFNMVLVAEPQNHKRISMEARRRFEKSIIDMGYTLDEPYVDAKTPIQTRCDKGHPIHKIPRKILNKVCQGCDPGGFAPAKAGTVYFLLSDCGSLMKVGISGDVAHRIRKLSKRTPFSFKVYGLRQFKSGYDAVELEAAMLEHATSAGLHGFDGCTEWVKVNPTLLKLVDNILRVR